MRETIELLTPLILAARQRQDGALTVGIDGPDCAGKSTLARRLVTALKADHIVVLIHFDDYSNDRIRREARGEFSAEAFYFDYFDQARLVTIIDELRRPPGRIDILLVEGLFLFRDELTQRFDFRIRLEIDEAEVMSRALARDVGQIGDIEWVRAHYERQCLPAQRRYIAEHSPREVADVCLRSNRDKSFDVCR